MGVVKNKKINSIKNRQQIVGSLDLSHLTKTQQDKIISMLMENVVSRFNKVVWDILSKEEKKEFKKISGEKKFFEYVNTKTGDLPGLVETVTRQVVDDFRVRRLSFV